jgi:Na+-driven multidrug efflux pump
MRRLLVAGRHLFVRTAALLTTLALATAVATRLGPDVLGGHQIALQVHTFLALVLDSLAIPGQIMVGTLLGAGDREEAAAVARRLVHLGIGCGVVVGAVLLALSRLLPRVFTHDASVRHAATVALVVAAAVQIPAAIAFVLDGVLIGGSDFRFLQWSMLAGLAVYLPFAAGVLRFHSLGVAGVWVGLLAWMTGRALANYARYRGRRWADVSGR